MRIRRRSWNCEQQRPRSKVLLLQEMVQTSTAGFARAFTPRDSAEEQVRRAKAASVSLNSSFAGTYGRRPRAKLTLNVETNMSGSRQLWTKIAQIAKMLEGTDDPTGDYMLSLEKRIDKLEGDLRQLKGQLRSHPGDIGI